MQTKGTPPPPPAVLYAAKSTEDNRGSTPDQLARARAMATERGWRVAGEFADEGFSAYWRNRGPGLERAKATVVELAGGPRGCAGRLRRECDGSAPPQTA